MRTVFSVFFFLSLSAFGFKNYQVQIKSYDLVRKVAGAVPASTLASAEQNVLVYYSPDANPASTMVRMTLRICAAPP